jgi:NADH:ubiquinone oxidoreductase subunit F (NADH-binding)
VHPLPRRLGLAGARLPALARGEGEPGDIELLANVANGIGGNTICALGDAAAWPMLGFITKFRADFEAKLAQPARVGARRRRAVGRGLLGATV